MSAMALAMVCALTLLTTHSAQAQTFSVLHYFTGGARRGNPLCRGYRRTLREFCTERRQLGGTHNHGTVFKLSQTKLKLGFQSLVRIYRGQRWSRAIRRSSDRPKWCFIWHDLYGGGAKLRDSVRTETSAHVLQDVLCYWNETILYTFTGTPDGEYPEFVNLAFDQAGNIYGTTAEGGMYGDGTTFELTPSGGGYTESILHSFGGGTDGAYPYAGVVLDAAGNVYGTTPTAEEPEQNARGGCGTVYQLMPSKRRWLENVLVNFDGANGYTPFGNLIIDASGNLYGTTTGRRTT